MNPLSDFLLFLLLAIGGVIGEAALYVVYTRFISGRVRSKQFSLTRYAYVFFMPIVAIIVLAIKLGPSILYIAVSASIIGMILEWLAGFAYHIIVGERMWTYHQYHITGYTSFLSLPLWALVGVLLWLLARIFI